MMGVDCKRQIIRALQPLLGAADKVFQVPGSELILVLDGPEPSSRLNHMVAVLNHKKFSWHNQPLDLEFGAAWGRDDGQGEGLYQMLGQLSWLSEQAGSERRCWRWTRSRIWWWIKLPSRCASLCASSKCSKIAR